MVSLSLKDLPLKGKKVLIRVDFNVPLDKNGQITDDARIEASLPTIKYVLEQGGTPILMSHLGRPKGEVKSELSLAPCAVRLSQMLGRPVIMAPETIGEKVTSLVGQLKTGESILLENLRFNKAEEKPDTNPNFAKQLADLADVYINDAFGTAHRAHASTVDVVQYFPGAAVPGFLLEKEIQFLGKTLMKPRRPFYGVIGGAKVSTKIGVMTSLASKVDALLVGGAMAYTFLKARGIKIGGSKYEPELVAKAHGIIDAYDKAGIELLLPVDHVCVSEVKEGVYEQIITNEEGIPDNMMGVDIGPKTIELFSEELDNATTVFWNGPLGIFEIKDFSKGTRAIANVLAGLKGIKIVGGGDSVAAIRQANLVHKFDHLSTGGGASLEYIEFGTLPGIEALDRQVCNWKN